MEILFSFALGLTMPQQNAGQSELLHAISSSSRKLLSIFPISFRKTLKSQRMACGGVWEGALAELSSGD